MHEHKFFLHKLEELKSPSKAELLAVLKLWLVEARSDEEIGSALGGKNRTTATRKIVEICEHFGTAAEGRKRQRQSLVLLFRKYCQDFEVHPSIYPEWSVDSFSDRLSQDRGQDQDQDSTNSQLKKFEDLERLDFIGRAVDFDHLTNFLQSKTKIILIKAAAGVGKTRLAEEFLKQKFKQVVEIKIGLESGNVIPAEEKVAQIIQESFGILPSLSFQQNLSILKSKLSDVNNEIGVLIDNIEPALDADFRLREDEQIYGYRDLLVMLSHQSVCAFTLITSRRSINAQHYTLREYPLKGLDVAAWRKYFHNCKNADDSEALTEMCRVYNGNSKVMNILHGAITNRFDGNIAAYWDQYQETLLADHELEALVSIEMDWLRNHQVDAYNLLCRMSCYRYQDVKTIPFKGLLSLVWDLPENSQKNRILNYLIKTSLIEIKIEYYLHPMVREAALSRLVKNKAEWQRSHQAGAEFWLKSIDQVRNIDDVLKVLEAYYHYLEIGDFEMAGQVMLTKKANIFNTTEELGYSLLKFGLVNQVINNLSQLISKIDNLALKAQVIDILAFGYWLNGDLNECLKCHKLVRQISIKLDSQKFRIQSLFGVASCAFNLGEMKKSWKTFELVYSLIQDSEYYTEFADTHWLLALFSSIFCKPERTYLLIKEGLEIDLSKTKLGASSKGYRFILLGLAYKNIGEVDKCFNLYQSALLYAQEINSDLFLGLAKSSLATIYREQNNFDTALPFHLEAVELLSKTGAKCELGNAYVELGLTYKIMDQQEKAEECKVKALDIQGYFILVESLIR